MKKFRFILLMIALVAAVVASSYLPEPIPAERMNFSSSGYSTSCALVLGLFVLSMVLSCASGRLSMSPLSKLLLIMGVGVLFLVGMAFLIIKLTAGAITWLWGVGAPVIVIGLSLWLYFHYRKRAGEKASSGSVRRSASGSGEIKFDFKVLYSSMALLLVVALIALLAGAPTHYLVLPLAFATLATLLWKVSGWRGFLLLGVITTVLYIVKYCIPAYISFTTDKFWPSMALTLLYLGLIVPLSDLYCRKEQSI